MTLHYYCLIAVPVFVFPQADEIIKYGICTGGAKRVGIMSAESSIHAAAKLNLRIEHDTETGEILYFPKEPVERNIKEWEEQDGRRKLAFCIKPISIISSIPLLGEAVREAFVAPLRGLKMPLYLPPEKPGEAEEVA